MTPQMKMNKRMPTGFKNQNLQSVRERIKLCSVMARIMEKHGFKHTEVTALYPISESFPREGQDGRFKLVDATGEVLCVLEDAVTGLLNAAETDLERLCTYAEVYNFAGKERNVSEFAALLTGFAGFEAECEMISVGLAVMKELGVKCSKIVLGNTNVLKGIAEVYLNTKVDRETIDRILFGEDFKAAKTDVDYALERLLKETAQVKGDLEAIHGVAEKVGNPKSVNGLLTLLELSKLLEDLGYGDMIEFDLSLTGASYDNGTVFRLCDAENNVLMEGGRHDFIREGGVCRAVSLRANPDKILALHPLKSRIINNDAVIGMSDGINALKSAYRLKNSLTDNNLSVAVLYRTSKEATVAYAKAYGIASVIFIEEDGKIINLNSYETNGVGNKQTPDTGVSAIVTEEKTAATAQSNAENAANAVEAPADKNAPVGENEGREEKENEKTAEKE